LWNSLLIHNQHRLTLTELLHDEFAQYVARRVGIPPCSLEKVLHTIGRCFANPRQAARPLAFDRTLLSPPDRGRSEKLPMLVYISAIHIGTCRISTMSEVLSSVATPVQK
jgi:hypothetical protein